MRVRQKPVRRRFSITVTFEEGRVEVYDNLDAETFVARIFVIIEEVIAERSNVNKITVNMQNDS